MLSQYNVLSTCQSLLKNANIPNIQRVMLDVQLIQAKQIILNDTVYSQVEGNVGSESKFEELHRQVEAICGCDGKPDTVATLIEYLNEILEGLMSYVGSDIARLYGNMQRNKVMPIMVRYNDYSVGYVMRDELDELLRADDIMGFRRSDGWVDPKRDPVRGQGDEKEYDGPERRG